MLCTTILLLPMPNDKSATIKVPVKVRPDNRGTVSSMPNAVLPVIHQVISIPDLEVNPPVFVMISFESLFILSSIIGHSRYLILHHPSILYQSINEEMKIYLNTLIG